jgi:hypothetical protein
MKLKSLAAATVLLASVATAPSAHAAVIFSDDFHSEGQATNYNSFANWNVAVGTVDSIGTGFFDFYPGNGNYVDLDGSSTQLGTLSSKTIFGAGTYKISFSLGAYTYQGQYPLEGTRVSIGTWNTTITPAVDSSFNPGAPLQNYSFIVTTNGGALNFEAVNPQNPGQGTNVGNILDNVQVSSVPESSTWIMMLIGFAGIGLITFRRTRKLSAALPVT